MWQVMIVDDEPSILEGLEKIIPWEEYGLELTHRVTSGTQALEVIKNNPVHILLADIQMPDMSGLELIEHASKLNPSIHTIILTAFDAFEYVKKAIILGVENYLLKPINRTELSKTLLKTIENLQREQLDLYGYQDKETFRTNILNRWMMDSIEQHELAERAEFINVNLQAGEYVVAAIKCLEPVNRDIKLAKLILEQTFLQKLQGETFLNPFGDLVLLIYGRQIKEKISYIENLLYHALSTLKSNLGISGFAVIGKVVTNAEKVPDAYQSAMSLLPYSMLKPANSVIIYMSPVSTTSMTSFKLPELDRHVFDKCCDEVIADINTFLLELLKSTTHHLPEAKYLVLDMLFQMIQQTRKITKNADQIPSSLNNLLSTFETISTFEQLKEWLITIYATFTEFRNSHQLDQNPLLKTILHFLETHYAEDISLRSLSTKHNINVSYLGQLFKNETGELFSVYLNNLRMDRAENLLKNSTDKVGDIAAKVGYNNISYFNHNFKLRFGKTPVQYRQQLS